MKHPSCTIYLCHRRACLLVEERVNPWKWERRWRCDLHADVGEVRTIAVKSAAILAIEAAGRAPVVVAVPVVVEPAPVEVAPVVVVAKVASKPAPAPKAPRKTAPRKQRVQHPRGRAVVVEAADLPQPSPGKGVAEWGSTLHRLVSRVAAGQLLGDAMDSEEVGLKLAGHAYPSRVAGQAAGNARRLGMVGADGRLTDTGRVWLARMRRDHEILSAPSRDITAQILADAAGLIEELATGIDLDEVGARYGCSGDWLRKRLAKSPHRARYLEVAAGRKRAGQALGKQRRAEGRAAASEAKAARKRARAEAEAEAKAVGSKREPQRTGRIRNARSTAPALEALAEGLGIKAAAKRAGMPVSTLRNRLRTDGLWPRADLGGAK